MREGVWKFGHRLNIITFFVGGGGGGTSKKERNSKKFLEFPMDEEMHELRRCFQQTTAPSPQHHFHSSSLT